MPIGRNYDYIIVGAGSGGCTLAGRLSEDRSRRVLLIEAGGWDRDPWIKIPLGWPRLLLNRKHDWMYFAEPESSTGATSLFPPPGIVEGRRQLLSRQRWPAGDADDAIFRSAGRGFRRCWACRRIQEHTGLQRRAAGRLRRLADDGEGRSPLQCGGCLSAPGAAKVEPTCRGQCACDQARLRRPERGGDRIYPRRQNRHGPCRTRGGPVWRRHQLAATVDAIWRRRSCRTRSARYRSESAAARRRQELAGPHFGEHCLRPQGIWAISS